MTMNLRGCPALAALLAGIVAGCSTTANLYPVSGPVAAQRPLPVSIAKVDGITGNTGGISVTMPYGEECVGKWSSAAPTIDGAGTLISQYGTVVGFSISALKPGVNRGEAFLTCSGGTTIQAEFYTGSGTANGYGLAKDSRSNVYKLLF